MREREQWCESAHTCKHERKRVREGDDGQRERYARVCARAHTRTHSHIRASARTATTAAAREVQRRALEPEVRGMARALTWSVKICSPYFSAISWGKLYLHDARKSRTHRARERLCGAPKRAPARMHCRHGGRTLLPCRQQRNASQACAFPTARSPARPRSCRPSAAVLQARGIPSASERHCAWMQSGSTRAAVGQHRRRAHRAGRPRAAVPFGRAGKRGLQALSCWQRAQHAPEGGRRHTSRACRHRRGRRPP